MLRDFLTAALMVLVSGSAARAGPAFEILQQACLQNAGDRVAALASPKLVGWITPPKAVTDEAMASQNDGTVITRAEARAKKDESGMFLFVVGHINRITDGLDIPAEFCGLAASQAQGSNLQAEAAAYAAVPLNQKLIDALTDPKERNATVIYSWRDEDGVHKNISAAELAAAAPNESVRVLSVQNEGGLTMAMLAVPAK